MIPSLLESADWQPLRWLTDAGIAMLGAMALFVIPTDSRRRQFAMDWATARRLPWGILILFGGGLSLASAVRNNHVAEFLGSQASQMEGLPPLVVMLVVVGAIVFLTELTSNMATAATMLPILAAMAPGLGVHPYWLVLPSAIACSCAFMLPVATPPNAIVFGSGEITINQMMKAGFWLNLVSIILIVLMSRLLLGPMFGL
jgi:sodium-dependent dicarboxylate transporter 2/3/5